MKWLGISLQRTRAGFTLYAPLSWQEQLTLTLAQKWKYANVNKQLASSTMEKFNRAHLKWKKKKKTVRGEHNACCKHYDCNQNLLKHSSVTRLFSECSGNVWHQAPRLMNTAHYTTKPVGKLTKYRVKKSHLLGETSMIATMAFSSGECTRIATNAWIRLGWKG